MPDGLHAPRDQRDTSTGGGTGGGPGGGPGGGHVPSDVTGNGLAARLFGIARAGWRSVADRVPLQPRVVVALLMAAAGVALVVAGGAGIVVSVLTLGALYAAVGALGLLGTRADGTSSNGRNEAGDVEAPDDAETQVHDASWRMMVDAIPDPAVILDRDRFVVAFSPPVADLFPRVRVGQPLASLSRSPDLVRALQAIDAGGETQVVELEDRVPVLRHLSAIVTAIGGFSDAGEGEPRYMILLRDLTEQQRHAQSRADFISHASHELRTPLSALKSMVETLQGPARNDPEGADRFLAMMQTQAARMARLIDDLLSLSKAEMRVHLAPTGTVDLNEVAGDVAEALEPMAQSIETTLTFSPLSSPAWVRADRDDLVQVFQNLVQNALKYGREGGHVRIELSRQPGQRGPEKLLVSVIDDGEGIEPEHLPRLTERFYRISVTTSRNKGGTGLGLAIVKHLVSRHRGELRIASKPGEGSRFTVVLDAVMPPTAQGPDRARLTKS